MLQDIRGGAKWVQNKGMISKLKGEANLFRHWRADHWVFVRYVLFIWNNYSFRPIVKICVTPIPAGQVSVLPSVFFIQKSSTLPFFHKEMCYWCFIFLGQFLLYMGNIFIVYWSENDVYRLISWKIPDGKIGDFSRANSFIDSSDRCVEHFFNIERHFDIKRECPFIIPIYFYYPFCQL